MPRASRRPVRKDVEIELQANFAFLISSLSSSKEIQHFFDIFLSDEEKIMLTKRLMLHLMIESNYDQEDISNILCLSIGTIYRHKVILQIGGAKYKDTISKIGKRRKTKEFWRKVEKALRPIGLILEAKSNMRARAKLLTGDFD